MQTRLRVSCTKDRGTKLTIPAGARVVVMSTPWGPPPPLEERFLEGRESALVVEANGPATFVITVDTE
jgi:hypothetical protein